MGVASNEKQLQISADLKIYTSPQIMKNSPRSVQISISMGVANNEKQPQPSADLKIYASPWESQIMKNSPRSVHIWKYTPVTLIQHFRCWVGQIKAKVEGKGNVELLTQYNNKTYILRLQNVLYIPTNRNSLFSLGKWDSAGGKYVGAGGKMWNLGDGFGGLGSARPA